MEGSRYESIFCCISAGKWKFSNNPTSFSSMLFQTSSPLFDETDIYMKIINNINHTLNSMMSVLITLRNKYWLLRNKTKMVTKLQCLDPQRNIAPFLLRINDKTYKSNSDDSLPRSHWFWILLNFTADDIKHFLQITL